MEPDVELNLSAEEFNELKLLEAAAKEVIIEFLEKHNAMFNNNLLVSSANGSCEYIIPKEQKKNFLAIFNYGYLYYIENYISEDIIDMNLIVDFPVANRTEINVYLITGIDSRKLAQFLHNNNDLDAILIAEDDDTLEAGYNNSIAIPIFESLQQEIMHKYNFK